MKLNKFFTLFLSINNLDEIIDKTYMSGVTLTNLTELFNNINTIENKYTSLDFDKQPEYLTDDENNIVEKFINTIKPFLKKDIKL